jgi:hypothetical protein
VSYSLVFEEHLLQGGLAWGQGLVVAAERAALVWGSKAQLVPAGQLQVILVTLVKLV